MDVPGSILHAQSQQIAREGTIFTFFYLVIDVMGQKTAV
jgi:hypothetical protein